MHRGESSFLVLVFSVVVISSSVVGDFMIEGDTLQSRDHNSQDHSKTRTHADYPDTNYNPTKSEQSVNMDSEEGSKVVNQVESSLLNMFGLKSRPRPKDKIEIPQYMIDMYKELAAIEGDVELNLKPRNSQQIKRFPGNTIRSYYHEDKTVPTEKSHHKTTLFFNVTQMPEEESLEGAELRVYRLQANDSYISQQSENTSSSINKKHRINIYEIIKPATKHQEAITRLIDTRHVYPHKSKWESFDIEPAIKRWRRSPKQNHGLEVHYTDLAGEKPDHEHVRLRRSLEHADSDWNMQQPFLIVYSDDGKDIHQRQKRNAETREEKKRRKTREKDRAKQRKKKKNHCKRHPLYVDFQSVGWTDWIIAPPGYDAYYCHGECPFYMPDHLNATNHAIVQNMVNSFNPQAAPKPCCVPTELSDIAMLYLDEVGKVVLKTYQEMVVEACGCR